MDGVTSSVMRISLAGAEVVLDAAVAHATVMGVPQNIAIVDDAGHLVSFRRMDGASFITIEIAINKAFTAAGARASTQALQEVAQPGVRGYGLNTQHHGRFTVLAGGLPLRLAGTVVGGIGVSGGTTDQDHEVAQVAVDAYEGRIAEQGGTAER
jgi:uncharacterized protein GlcG (DUF336 family)